MERMTGADAFMLWLEGPNAPMHTLKVVVLEDAGDLTVDDVADVLARARRAYPRLGQRACRVPLGLAQPVWVNDPHFDATAHVAERTADPPGDRAALDRALGEIASTPLDPDRPLWDATVLHGLEAGRAAVVLKVHHCVTDGVGAASALTAFTSAGPGEPPDASLDGPWATEPIPGPSRLARDAIPDLGRRLHALPGLISDSRRSRERNKQLRAGKGHLVDTGLVARLTSLNRAISAERICATASLPFDAVQRVKEAAGVTVNAVLLGVVAEANMRELHRRGEVVEPPFMASFGMATDDPGTRRMWGNRLTTIFSTLCVEVEDPFARMTAIGRAARDEIEIRRELGVDAAARWQEYSHPLQGRFFQWFLPRSPRTAVNVVTANVPGPREPRWVGRRRVADWYSFAVLQPMSGVNVTMYTYAGKVEVGVLSAPELIADPSTFTTDMAEVLATLTRSCA